MTSSDDSSDDPKIELDPLFPTESEKLKEKRALLAKIKSDQIAQRKENEDLLYRQSLQWIDQGNLPRPVRAALVCVWPLALSTVWTALSRGSNQFLMVVSILGFQIRPLVVIDLFTALVTTCAGLHKLRAVRAALSHRILTVAEPQAVQEVQLRKLSILRFLIALTWGVVSFFLATLGLCILGWEPALSYLAGFRAFLLICAVLGAGILIFLYGYAEREQY